MNTAEIFYEPDFPKEEYAARYRRARQLMDENGYDALLLSLGIHLRYLTGYRTPFWGDAPGIQGDEGGHGRPSMDGRCHQAGLQDRHRGEAQERRIAAFLGGPEAVLQRRLALVGD